MKKVILFLTFGLILNFTSNVNALDLQQARAQGIISEQPDGYVRATVPTAEATQLADKVNAARKAEYQRISKENGQPVDVVAKIAAGEIAKKIGK